MRKSIIILSAALLAAASCSDMIDAPVSQPASEQEKTVITFDLGGDALTKATAAGSENAVSSLQVLLFRNGTLYGSGKSTASSLSMEVGPGTYNCYAFVNDPTDWSGNASATESGITSAVSKLESNTTSMFVMFGKLANKEITASTKEVTIPVNRFVSKVEIDKISVNFDAEQYYDGMALKVTGIYLTNVFGTCPYSMTPSTSPAAGGTWYNKMGYVSEAKVNTLLSETGLNITIEDNASHSNAHYFYAYPNACSTDSQSGTWSARKTRLVIEAELDGEECYYHIDIPDMKPNTLYKITECTIKNVGGSSPEENFSAANLTFKISITDWATGFSKEVIFE